ncbi:ATP-dependent (S)-NAD(P)H-hydrate dehydratase [Grifola frondosa]|uniref:ATP-dependent (S)-NAD(P)H-hydrate dehydratase n=1 Tax=Grifola frondosa TaxID=5627 RepID=A0A1C7M213_GRIFR|nr:ATP-dependent (S)-NAD(P)H-hydrate dehydratase [Grifola frondosa]
MPVPRHIIEQLKQLIPPLNGSLYKGQSGRVGVLGGALDYTGAPFFASMSALRIGADLSHVICSPAAAGAIKSYSPDLIVHPILREEETPSSIRPTLSSLLSRLHVLVLGPGLGREDYMVRFAKLALNIAKDQARRTVNSGMYVVLDADALWMVGQDLALIRGYRRAVLTPNVVEFKRLSENVNIDPATPPGECAMCVSRALGGVTILQKGGTDIICTNTVVANAEARLRKVPDGDSTEEQVDVDVPGGLKRCGGQGDILSGTVGAIMAWGKCYEDGAFGMSSCRYFTDGTYDISDQSLPPSRIPLLAAVGGSMVTRTASKIAFEKHGRGVVTQDMLGEIGGAFSSIFSDKSRFPIVAVGVKEGADKWRL